jgi:hypothetical protein
LEKGLTIYKEETKDYTMENVSDITIAYEEDGEVLLEELDKVVLQKAGALVVILFRYREKVRKTGEFGSPKLSLRRYQKLKGSFRKKDNVNLSKDSIIKLKDILDSWLTEGLLDDNEK